MLSRDSSFESESAAAILNSTLPTSASSLASVVVSLDMVRIGQSSCVS